MAAHQVPPSLGFSRQEHWSGLPIPSPMHEKWKVKGKLLSRVRLFTTPWTAAHQPPPSMGFSRQEYWNAVPSPSPRSYGNSMFIILRNFHTALHNGYIYLHSQKQCKRVPFSQHLLHYLSFVDFLMMAILTGMRWYLIIVLIDISIIISDDEHLFMSILAMFRSSLDKSLFRSSAHFLFELLFL